MKKATKKFLLEKRIDGSAPVRVRFTTKKGEYKFFNAREGNYFIKWNDVLKAFRIEHKEIRDLIRADNNYTKANILDKDIAEWLR